MVVCAFVCVHGLVYVCMFVYVCVLFVYGRLCVCDCACLRVVVYACMLAYVRLSLCIFAYV